MAARKITLHCDVTVKDILCSAIRNYAHAAYPDGGSECAQVARYTLLELAADIDAGISEHSDSVAISRRPRAMVKAAIEYYFNCVDERQGMPSIQQRKLFTALLEGESGTSAELQRAVAADHSR
jgi:hypothetical protein